MNFCQKTMMTRSLLLTFFSCFLICAKSFAADPLLSDGEDGYRLWLKYEPVSIASVKAEYLKYTAFIVQPAKGEILQSASRELQMGLEKLLGNTVHVTNSAGGKTGGIIFKIESGADTTKPAE